jgi:methyl-accepting chemotaxis protein
MVTVSELDAKALEVLEAVYENGGEADTSEIKEYTGIKKNGIVHYRYEKLEEAGLIETRTGEPDGTKMPPTVAELTEKARKEINGGLFGEEGATVVERMDRLERQYRQSVEALREVQRDFERWRFDPETDEEIGAWEIAERIEDLEELAEQIEERDEETESLEDVADTVDWAERVIDKHHSRLAEIEAELGELQEAVGDEFDVEQLQSSVASAQADAETAREESEAARKEAREARQTVQSVQQDVEVMKEQSRNRSDSGTFWSRLRWLFTGSEV